MCHSEQQGLGLHGVNKFPHTLTISEECSFSNKYEKEMLRVKICKMIMYPCGKICLDINCLKI